MSQRRGSGSAKGSTKTKDEGKESETQQEEEADCPICAKKVENGDLALECEICESWFHIKCQDVKPAEYEFLKEHKSVH